MTELQPGPAVALVIPTLREIGSLGTLLGRVCRVTSAEKTPCEIIVVDDNSRDGTEELVGAIAREDPRVRLLVRRGRRGLSGAILEGWQSSAADILGVMDADLQHPPELIPTLLERIRCGNDVAMASRYVAGGGIGSWHPIRSILSKSASAAALPLQRLRICDPLSGFFMVRRRCIERTQFQAEGFKLLLEILVRGDVRTVSEVPFRLGSRRAGRSKAGLKVGWDYMRLLAHLYASGGTGRKDDVRRAIGD